MSMSDLGGRKKPGDLVSLPGVGYPSCLSGRARGTVPECLGAVPPILSSRGKTPGYKRPVEKTMKNRNRQEKRTFLANLGHLKTYQYVRHIVNVRRQEEVRKVSRGSVAAHVPGPDKDPSPVAKS